MNTIHDRRARTVRTSPYGAAVLAGEVARVRRADRGERHVQAWAASATVAEFIAGGEINEAHGYACLRDAILDRGIPYARGIRQIESGFARGFSNPPRMAGRGMGKVGSAQECRQVGLAAVQSLRASGAAAMTIKIGTAIIEYLISLGKVETVLSGRDVAEICGTCHSTVLNHRDRLAEWIRYIPPEEPTHAGKWRLLPVRHVSPLTYVNTLDPAANCWNRKPGLWLVACHLSPIEETTVDELADYANRSVATIKRYVKELVAGGLAVVTSSGAVVAVEGAELPETEVDHAAERQARHDAERAAYAQRMARFEEWVLTLPVDEQAAARDRQKFSARRKRRAGRRTAQRTAAGSDEPSEYATAA